MAYYTKTRNTELSTLKFIEDSLAVDWPGVNIIKTWSQLEKVANPVICVALTDTNYTREELGATTYRDTYIFTIDLFAKSDAMRIDLSHWLMNTLNPGWTYYEVSQASGNNRSLVYTDAGRCRIDFVYENSKVNLGLMGNVKDKYRQNIIIAVTVGC